MRAPWRRPLARPGYCTMRRRGICCPASPPPPATHRVQAPPSPAPLPPLPQPAPRGPPSRRACCASGRGRHPSGWRGSPCKPWRRHGAPARHDGHACWGGVPGWAHKRGGRRPAGGWGGRFGKGPKGVAGAQRSPLQGGGARGQDGGSKFHTLPLRALDSAVLQGLEGTRPSTVPRGAVGQRGEERGCRLGGRTTPADPGRTCFCLSFSWCCCCFSSS